MLCSSRRFLDTNQIQSSWVAAWLAYKATRICDLSKLLRNSLGKASDGCWSAWWRSEFLQLRTGSKFLSLKHLKGKEAVLCGVIHSVHKLRWDFVHIAFFLSARGLQFTTESIQSLMSFGWSCRTYFALFLMAKTKKKLNAVCLQYI